MKLNEHMSKKLFSRAGILVPPGFLYSGNREKVPAEADFDFPWAVKAQVLSGGRGKAGGISIVRDHAEFLKESGRILNMHIRGEAVPFVRVEQATDIRREFYVSFSVNREGQKIVLTVGRQGGVDIEHTGADNFLLLQIDPCRGLSSYQLRQAFFHLGLKKDVYKKWAETCFGLYNIFAGKHLLLAEINPLVLDQKDTLLALDGKVEIDDNYFALASDLESYFVPEHMDPVELEAGRAGLNFHRLDGFVGLMVNGAGLAMATMDLLNFSDLPAANFLDMGGGASEEKMARALDILCRDESVRVVFINIFGGILSCAKVARAMRSVLKKNSVKKEIIVRFSGFESEQARDIIRNADLGRLRLAEDLTQAVDLLSEYKSGQPQSRFRHLKFPEQSFSRIQNTLESSKKLLPDECGVLVQGITGKEGMLHTRMMLDYGTRIKAGVTPFKGGTDVHGIPVYNTVKEACRKHEIGASIIFVPPALAADAILEAADAGIKWVVCITEGIPQQEMLKVRQQLFGTGTRLIGPNTPGLIIPGRIKIGIMPGDVFTPGPVAVLSRSGTLTYESVFRLTRAGIGQSACIGIGGDPFVGSSFRDIAELLLDDPATKALLVLGEIGGRAEEELGEYLNKKGFNRPLFGFIAGQTAPPGKRLGHAGAILEDNAGIEGKLKKMHDTGYTVCPDLTSISERIGRILA